MYDIIAATLKDLKKFNVDRFVLCPERWVAFACSAPLSWTKVRFERAQQNLIPNNRQGVYSFVVKPGIANHSDCSYLMYVGKAEDQSLRDRFTQYFYERTSPKGRPKVQKMLSLWECNLWFCWAEIDDTALIHSTEQALISAYLPPMNDEFPAEVRKAMKAW